MRMLAFAGICVLRSGSRDLVFREHLRGVLFQNGRLALQWAPPLARATRAVCDCLALSCSVLLSDSRIDQRASALLTYGKHPSLRRCVALMTV